MSNESVTVQRIKVWAFPILISIVGWFAISALQEIRTELETVKADVKTLLAQSNIDKTRIDNLEREVFDKSAATTTGTSSLPIPQQPVPRFITMEFIPVNPEEVFTVRPIKS